MPTYVTVRRNLVVPALLEIEDSEFAHWYSLGVYWAMYGDCQGTGLYHDTYIIDTIENGIRNGWYADLNSGWFPHIGFYVGMLHGGMLDPTTRTLRPTDRLVVLTNPDFTKGYYVGRTYHFTEAIPEGRIFSDTLFCQSVYEWAAGFHEWNEANEVLAYVLGCRIGELSAAIIPATMSVTQPVMAL